MKRCATTLKKLFFISRPISWPNTAYPFAAGYLIAMLNKPVDIPLLIIGTLYFLGPYNLLMYGINDVYDYESDIKNPRKGGVEGMKEERALHPTILWASTLINAPFLLYLFIISSWPARAILAVVIFAVIAYSLKGLRFKEIPVLDSITSSIHFVGPLVFALSLVGFSGTAWPFVIAFFLWGMASHAFGAVQDIIPDKEGELRSVATALGARLTVWGSAAFYLIASIIIFLQGTAYIAVGLAGLAYVINIAQYLTVTDRTSGTTNKAWRRFLWLNYAVGAIVTMTIITLL